MILRGMMGNRGQVNYSAAKAGLIGAGKALSGMVRRIDREIECRALGTPDPQIDGPELAQWCARITARPAFLASLPPEGAELLYTQDFYEAWNG